MGSYWRWMYCTPIQLHLQIQLQLIILVFCVGERWNNTTGSICPLLFFLFVSQCISEWHTTTSLASDTALCACCTAASHTHRFCHSVAWTVVRCPPTLAASRVTSSTLFCHWLHSLLHSVLLFTLTLRYYSPGISTLAGSRIHQHYSPSRHKFISYNTSKLSLAISTVYSLIRVSCFTR
jgi:hypothetical protein